MFQVPLVVQMTDDEKYLWRGLDFDEAKYFMRENVKGRWELAVHAGARCRTTESSSFSVAACCVAGMHLAPSAHGVRQTSWRWDST